MVNYDNKKSNRQYHENKQQQAKKAKMTANGIHIQCTTRQHNHDELHSFLVESN